MVGSGRGNGGEKRRGIRATTEKERGLNGEWGTCGEVWKAGWVFGAGGGGVRGGGGEINRN